MWWHFTNKQLDLNPPVKVMGIVNVTPDSFSDGGKYSSTERAIEHGLKLVEHGADLLDIGGESSRPGALPVPLEEELRRVVPVVEGLAKRTTVPISVDTTKAEVARRALAVGAQIINDITALRGDSQMASVVRETKAGVILMHMQGTPQTMQISPHYRNVVTEVKGFLAESAQYAKEQGIAPERIVLDPGIGFGKTFEHNLELIRNLPEFGSLGYPILLGVSRKGMIGQMTGKPTGERLIGSLTVAMVAVYEGGCHILRVHDVPETIEVVKVLSFLQKKK